MTGSTGHEQVIDIFEGMAFALEHRAAVSEAPLPLAVLLEEIHAWVTSARDDSWGNNPEKANRLSLKNEVEAAVQAVGSSLREHLGAALSQYLSAFEQVLRTPRREGEDVAALGEARRSLTERLLSAEGIGATWADLLKAVEDLGVFSAAGAAVQLESQLNLAGRDGSRVLNEVIGILRRKAWSIAMAREVWGGSDPQPWGESNLHAVVDVAPEEVMQLASHAVVEAGRRGHVVVWSMYDRAMLGTTSRDLGPMTVFMAEYIVGVAFERSDETSPLIEEFRALDHVRREHEQGRNFGQHVIVRIDLGNRTPVGAIEAATDLVETLMDALLSMGSASRWGKPVWSEVLLDGEERGSRFGRGSLRPAFDDTYGMRGLDSFLEEVSNHFARALLERPVPWHLRGALRACAEASHATSRAVSLYSEWHNDERSVVLLLDSAFEHLAAYGRMPMEDLSRRIGPLWPKADRERLIAWAVNSCLFPNDLMARSPEDVEPLKHDIVTSAGGLNFIAAYRQLDRLVAIARSPLQATVVRRLVGQLGDPALRAEEDARLRRSTALMIERQRRVRNALTHGNPVTQHVLASIVDFSQFRTLLAVRAGLDAFTEDRELDDYLASREAERVADDDLMESGQSQIEIWEARES